MTKLMLSDLSLTEDRIVSPCSYHCGTDQGDPSYLQGAREFLKGERIQRIFAFEESYLELICFLEW